MCLLWKKNVVVYYLLLWHLLFTVAIYYLGYISFVHQHIKLKYWNSGSLLSEAQGFNIRKKVWRNGYKILRESQVLKVDSVSFALPGFLLCAAQIEIILPAQVDMAQLWICTSQEPCSVFFLFEGQGCVFTVFFRHCTPNRLSSNNPLLSTEGQGKGEWWSEW